MTANYLTISLSIIAIFFITFIVIMIKNIYFNSKNYSRQLRFFMMMIGAAYIFNVGIFVWALLVNNPMKTTTTILTIGIAILAHLSMSMCGIWMMLHFDEKKTSVRDSWKYRAKHFKNFKLSPVPSRKFEWLIYFTKFLFVSIYLGMSITLIILATRDHSNVFMVMGIIGILDMIFNYVYLGIKTTKLIKLNSRYNELKTILLNDELNEETGKECAKKALKIYDQLFTCSPFYNKAIDTNNAIVIEIAERGGLTFLDTSKYLVDPITKMSSPVYANIEDRYEIPENWNSST